MSILGNRVLRSEDPKFLTVGGSYVADLADPALTELWRQHFDQQANVKALPGSAHQAGERECRGGAEDGGGVAPRDRHQPRVVGWKDQACKVLFSVKKGLDPVTIARGRRGSRCSRSRA